ncbi:signal peptidase [Burkholderia sp. SRS-W-2-2016]|uniref:signal peptidase n=1 Tax=Burkholderia sp. SRS-W-2-2016 TaxID=1926878 RepID=UPI00094B6947|nr:signal peptidase [Burkholderia sp. SRS-W-2-2016]OLL30153.1 signal peptidase [Burkholderia sp. SRS-W-2-2016]
MKKLVGVAAVLVVALTQAGCATQVKSLPFAAAGGESRGEVPVYFGQQSHQPVKTRLGEVAYSVRIARQTSSPDDACHQALAEAVRKLRAAARERHANAVIDVSTRFHSNETSSSTDFTCGVSPSAAAIGVRGQLVVLEAG